jgi:hypothetical protein
MKIASELYLCLSQVAAPNLPEPDGLNEIAAAKIDVPQDNRCYFYRASRPQRTLLVSCNRVGQGSS